VAVTATGQYPLPGFCLAEDGRMTQFIHLVAVLAANLLITLFLAELSSASG
jgi:hypothetical protein